METSVLLYSKYSKNSIRILETINGCGLDFSFLTKICVDNQNFRKRILYADQLAIKVVPCIILFRNNTAEKYEGGKAFEWVKEIIDREMDAIREEKARLYQQEQELLEAKRAEEFEREEARKREETPENIELREHQAQLQRNQQMAREKADQDHGKIDGAKISGKTSLMDLPVEDPSEYEAEEDLQPPPSRRKQILKDRGNYEEDDQLFSGEETDQRRPSGNVIRNEPRDGTKEVHKTYSQAEQMQKERDAFEAEMASPMKRPMDARRP